MYCWRAHVEDPTAVQKRKPAKNNNRQQQQQHHHQQQKQQQQHQQQKTVVREDIEIEELYRGIQKVGGNVNPKNVTFSVSRDAVQLWRYRVCAVTGNQDGDGGAGGGGV